jgi:hypothetical protein
MLSGVGNQMPNSTPSTAPQATCTRRMTQQPRLLSHTSLRVCACVCVQTSCCVPPTCLVPPLPSPGFRPLTCSGVCPSTSLSFTSLTGWPSSSSPITWFSTSACLPAHARDTHTAAHARQPGVNLGLTTTSQQRRASSQPATLPMASPATQPRPATLAPTSQPHLHAAARPPRRT